MNIKTVSLAIALACLASCTQYGQPDPLNGVRPLTGKINTERHDVKMVCGRAYGESRGFNLLGIIPITTASESEAIDKMYENARQRGAQLEGTPRQFVNTSFERSANYFILGSRPIVRVAADLVEIQHGSNGAALDAAAAPAQSEEEESSGLGAFLSAPYKLITGAIESVFGS